MGMLLKKARIEDESRDDFRLGPTIAMMFLVLSFIGTSLSVPF